MQKEFMKKINDSWVDSLLKNNLRLFFLYAVLAIAYTYPLVFSLNSKVIGDGGDNIEYFSYCQIVKQKLLNFELPFSHTTTFRFPNGFSLSDGSDGKLLSLGCGLLSFFVSPFTAFNISILLIIIINLFISHKYFFAICHSNLNALIGSIIFGSSYYVLAKGAGHFNIMQIYGIPLIALSTYYFIEGKNSAHYNKSVIYIFTGISLLQLGSIQSLLFGFTAVLVLGLVFVLHYPQKVIQKLQELWKIRLIILFALCSFLFIFLFFQKDALNRFFSQDFNIEKVTTSRYTQFSSLIFQNSAYITHFGKHINNLFSYKTVPSIENALSVGLIELTLFLIAIFITKNTQFKKYILVCTSVFFLLMLGSYKGEYFFTPGYYLKDFFPIKYIEETERFFPYFYIFFTSLIVIFLSQIKKSIIHSYFYSTILILLLAERVTGSYFLVEPYQVDRETVEIVSTTQALGVMDVPILSYGIFRATEYNTLPQQYNKPIVGGYFHWYGQTKRTQAVVESELANQFSCREKSFCSRPEYVVDSFNKLASLGITTIVIHRDLLSDFYCYPVLREMDYISSENIFIKNFDSKSTANSTIFIKKY